MSLLERYDPPAFLDDFNQIPGQLEAWHRATSLWFDTVVKIEEKTLNGPAQYYNAATFDPGGTVVEQAVTWNAFPKEMLRRYGRERALQLADVAWPIERYRAPSPDPTNPQGTSGILYRPQEEYCEWHVVRDPDTHQIRRVTFTSEPPEYWQALFGCVPGDGGDYADATFPGDRDLLLRLYRDLVSPDVQWEDLIAQTDLVDANGTTWVKQGQYNIYNKWNTTHGIAHLGAPPNSLVAEIQLGGDATITRVDRQGRILVEPDALIAYAAYGGPNRNSDPTIGSTVNALARLGAYVTLRNPVGLYMDHIDLAGWEAPEGLDPSAFVRMTRGTLGMIERLVVEAPPGRDDVCVGDLKIAGVPVRFGGQIAETITVKLVGLANVLAQPVKSNPVTVGAHAAIDPAHAATIIRARPASTPLLPGTIEAFRGEGTAPSTAKAAPRATRASTAAVKQPHQRAKNRTR
jgi:hypothetical protein